MLHPDSELRVITPEIGYGVVATRDIPRGTITWILDPLDRIMGENEVRSLAPASRRLVERYTWINAEGLRILCWDFGRYVNHSCEANSLSPGAFEFEIAVRDIAAGEEITSDYGTLNLERPMRCACGSSECRGTIRPRDFEKYADKWDEQIRTAFPLITRVPQPLLRWFPAPRSVIRTAAAHPDRLPSILAHRYVPMVRAGVR